MKKSCARLAVGDQWFSVNWVLIIHKINTWWPSPCCDRTTESAAMWITVVSTSHQLAPIPTCWPGPVGSMPTSPSNKSKRVKLWVTRRRCGCVRCCSGICGTTGASWRATPARSSSSASSSYPPSASDSNPPPYRPTSKNYGSKVIHLNFLFV